MTRPAALLQIATAHAALLAALLLVLGVTGRPLRGALLGGGLMALSMLLFAATARAAVAARRLFVAALASFKILLYLGLATAVLTGWVVADGVGFAAGVTCFVVATVGFAFLGPAVGETT